MIQKNISFGYSKFKKGVKISSSINRIKIIRLPLRRN